jgi:hypothetical protein
MQNVEHFKYSDLRNRDIGLNAFRLELKQYYTNALINIYDRDNLRT